MPKLSLLSTKRLEEGGADHIFDADQPGIGLETVVNEALADIFQDELVVSGMQVVWGVNRRD